MSDPVRSAKIKAALAEAKAKIAADGYYVTKTGKKITSLKSGRVTAEASAAGRASQSKRADALIMQIAGLVAKLRNDGQSLQATADALNEAGHRTTRGGLWSPIAVSRIEKRAKAMKIAQDWFEI
ncbi:hypothetical protein WEU32_06790 [Brevundimonas sp. BH3]|uniref:hypothetical protein n=1 Tax=Brevundimonas sp. BH3 TaxID=3133089 RepID=UPI00324B4088